MAPRGLKPIDLVGAAPEHYKGAAHECLAAAYYLLRGCQVYWPAMQQGAVDFVVQTEDGLYRVQVKTASWSRSGSFSYLQCRTRSANDVSPARLYDLLVVIHTDCLWEIPAHRIDSSYLCLAGTRPGYRGGKRWEKYRRPLPWTQQGDS